MQAQEVNNKANGVELVFYVNTAHGKVSRVWWLRQGGDPLQFRFATDEETQQAAVAKSAREDRITGLQKSTIPGGRRSVPDDRSTSWSALAFNAGRHTKQERDALSAEDEAGACEPASSEANRA